MKSQVFYHGDSYEHEKPGINMLLEAAPEENYLFLASIYGANNKITNREIDVLLLCPKGIFAIELKDWFGTIKEELNINSRKVTLTSTSTNFRSEDNPVHKAAGQKKKIFGHIRNNLDRLMDRDLLNKLNIDGGVKGAVFFTHTGLDFKVKETGDIIIITPDNPGVIWEERFTRDIFAEEDLLKIQKIFGKGRPSGGEVKFFNKGDIIDGYQIEKLLYDGEYRIYKAKNDMLGQSYFLKAIRIDPGHSADIQELTKEIAYRDTRTKAKLKNEPYVLFSSTPPKVYESYIISITDWIEHKSLADLIKNNISFDKKKEICAKLVLAIECLHQKDVYHRNLNPANIIFDTNGHIKLINFDFAKLQGRPTVIDGLLGSDDKYRALELINFDSNVQVDYRTDLYSLGVILYQFFSGKKPFTKLSDKFKGLSISFSDVGDCEILKKALESLMATNPEERDQGFLILKKWI